MNATIPTSVMIAFVATLGSIAVFFKRNEALRTLTAIYKHYGLGQKSAFSILSFCLAENDDPGDWVVAI
jgi:hypothetical protein